MASATPRVQGLATRAGAKFALTAIALLALAPNAPADNAFGIGPDLLYFDYREFDRDDNRLNEEQGVLPGIRLHTRAHIGTLFTGFEASIHGGDVDYTGQTQAGAPLHTHTATRLITLAGHLGTRLDALPGRWHGFVHAARRYWNRDIQGTGDVQGLFERYRWTEAGAGLRHAWPAGTRGDWHHSVELGAFAVIDGSVRVELSNLEGRDWDDITLALGDATGLRLRYRATHPLGHGRTLHIEPYLAFWSFGRSPTRPIHANGEPTGSRIAEPRSESRRFGLSALYTF